MHNTPPAPPGPPRARSSRRTVAALAIASTTTLLSAGVLAGDVRGALTVPTDFASSVAPPSDAESARARYWEEWNGFLEPRPARLDAARELAVVLTGGAASTGEQPALRLFNGSFFPTTLVVRVGVSTPLRNDDANPYEVYAEGLDDLGPVLTSPGNSRPVAVSAAGHWTLRDRNLGHVQGVLHALPDLVARAFVEPTGGYVFRDVPPGTYTLHVYQGASEVAPAQSVEVGDARELSVAPITLARP